MPSHVHIKMPGVCCAKSEACAAGFMPETKQPCSA